jgi:hypothetical protein
MKNKDINKNRKLVHWRRNYLNFLLNTITNTQGHESNESLQEDEELSARKESDNEAIGATKNMNRTDGK